MGTRACRFAQHLRVGEESDARTGNGAMNAFDGEMDGMMAMSEVTGGDRLASAGE